MSSNFTIVYMNGIRTIAPRGKLPPPPPPGEGLRAARQLPWKKIEPWFRFGLKLVLGLRGQFSWGAIVLEPIETHG